MSEDDASFATMRICIELPSQHGHEPAHIFGSAWLRRRCGQSPEDWGSCKFLGWYLGHDCCCHLHGYTRLYKDKASKGLYAGR